jgi:hypothetical protein
MSLALRISFIFSLIIHFIFRSVNLVTELLLCVNNFGGGKIKTVPPEKVIVAPLEAIPPIDERYVADALETVPLIKGFAEQHLSRLKNVRSIINARDAKIDEKTRVRL